jgi:hypothetical protein
MVYNETFSRNLQDFSDERKKIKPRLGIQTKNKTKFSFFVIGLYEITDLNSKSSLEEIVEQFILNY